MDFKPGKLYKSNEYFLMIYPTKEKASGRTSRATAAAPSATMPESATTAANETAASAWVKYWSSILDCRICYSKPGEIFMFLEKHGTCMYVLFGDKQGWITNKNWLRIVEAQNGS